MTPTIRVDDEVYALLQERGEAFVDTPNTVLRRILGLTESGESTGNPIGRREGSHDERASRKLARLVADDLLAPDEELVWERRNNGERHTARVGADGTLVLEDGHVADSPSAAARHLAGYEVNGWRVWRRADGTPLADSVGLARRERRASAVASTAIAASTVAAADRPRSTPIRLRLTWASPLSLQTNRCSSISRPARRVLAKAANNASRPATSTSRPATDISSEASDDCGPANQRK